MLKKETLKKLQELLGFEIMCDVVAMQAIQNMEKIRWSGFNWCGKLSAVVERRYLKVYGNVYRGVAAFDIFNVCERYEYAKTKPELEQFELSERLEIKGKIKKKYLT